MDEGRFLTSFIVEKKGPSFVEVRKFNNYAGLLTSL